MRRKIAVTIPEELVRTARRAVREGRAPSVSAFVTTALEEKVGSDGKTGRDRLIEMLDEMDRQYAPPGKEAEEWADWVLGLSSSTRGRSSRSRRGTAWPARSSGGPLIVELPSSSRLRSSRRSGATCAGRRASRG
jgi:antitoxin ParD1/3/4